MCRTSLLRKPVLILAALATLSTPAATATTPTVYHVENQGTASEKLISQLTDEFAALFTEVVQEQPDGSWEPEPSAAREFGLAPDEAGRIASYMEIAGSPSAHSQNRDLVSYADCAISNALPIPLSLTDAKDIGQLLLNKQWEAAARKVVEVASLNGATDLLRYGINAIGGVPAFVGKLALYASSCLVNEQLD